MAPFTEKVTVQSRFFYTLTQYNLNYAVGIHLCEEEYCKGAELRIHKIGVTPDFDRA